MVAMSSRPVDRLFGGRFMSWRSLGGRLLRDRYVLPMLVTYSAVDY